MLDVLVSWNNNSKILIKNIIIEDFEVAGIALNSCKNLIIEHCVLDNSNLIIDVNHKFALLKDLFNSLKKILKDEKKTFPKQRQVSPFLIL